MDFATFSALADRVIALSKGFQYRKTPPKDPTGWEAPTASRKTWRKGSSERGRSKALAPEQTGAASPHPLHAHVATAYRRLAADARYEKGHVDADHLAHRVAHAAGITPARAHDAIDHMHRGGHLQRDGQHVHWPDELARMRRDAEEEESRPGRMSLADHVAHAYRAAADRSEFDGLVPIPSLLRRMQKHRPGLTKEDLKEELGRQWDAGKIELRIANEAHRLSEDERSHGIRRGTGLHYYVHAPKLRTS